jgi:hypothetical protein
LLIIEGTACIPCWRAAAICIHYLGRESWITADNMCLVWNIALLIRAGVERELILDIGHETTIKENPGNQLMMI